MAAAALLVELGCGLQCNQQRKKRDDNVIKIAALTDHTTNKITFYFLSHWNFFIVIAVLLTLQQRRQSLPTRSSYPAPWVQPQAVEQSWTRRHPEVVGGFRWSSSPFVTMTHCRPSSAKWVERTHVKIISLREFPLISGVIVIDVVVS